MNDRQLKVEHLKLIQGVVDRLARNSFAVKATASAVAAALVSVIITQDNSLVSIGAISLVSLWVLDAFFLARERAYRALYEHVRTTAEDEMADEDFLTLRYSMPPRAETGAAFSRSLLLYYPPLFAAIIVAASLAA